jgi:hypothetical protein
VPDVEAFAIQTERSQECPPEFNRVVMNQGHVAVDYQPRTFLNVKELLLETLGSKVESALTGDRSPAPSLSSPIIGGEL